MFRVNLDLNYRETGAKGNPHNNGLKSAKFGVSRDGERLKTVLERYDFSNLRFHP